MRKLCLVTGASAGIGAALARTYAAKGYDLALTARRADRLEALAEELRLAHASNVIVLPADLAVPDAVLAVLAQIAARGRVVDVLVNNAGYGLSGTYAGTRWPQLEDMLQVMLTAVTQASHALLPEMMERRFGRILTIASVAGLIPGQAGAPLYNAIKAYLVRLSQSLHEEAAGTDVHVTALCPGFTRSEFHAASGAQAAMQALPGWMWMDADAVAEAGYAAAEANRAVSIPGPANQILAAAAKILPDVWTTAVIGRHRPR